MRIAVNTRFLLEGQLEGYGHFLHEVLQRWVAQHPGHQFIFLFDRPYSNAFVFGSNVTPVQVGPPARHPLLWKWWYDVKLPWVLRRQKADVFLSADGFCSLTTAVPQCLVVHDLAFLHYPGAIPRSHLAFYKRYTPRFLRKAASLATVSQFSKDDVVHQYGIEEKGIDVVFNGLRPVFQPLPFEQQLAVKEQWTGGAEYFLYTGAIHPRKNLLQLLRAFSVFKKRLQSGMKLVLAGRLAWQNDEFTTLLATYKYRNDVVLTGYLPDAALAGLTASAYALVYPSLFEGFGVPVLEAMHCGVPALTSANSAMQEVAGDAALYFDPNDHADIADKMMRVYKDESLRSRLIEKGRTAAQDYSWQRTADLLWQCLLRAVEKQG